MKIILAAVIGGIVMFGWGFVSHMTLGLGKSSIKLTPNEVEMKTMLQNNLKESGVYFLPTMDVSKDPTEAEMTEFAAKYKEGPNAIIFYNNDGSDAMSLGKLGTELATNIVASLLVAIILGLAAASFGRGVLISVMIGLIGWVSISLSYWTWYRFPMGFTIDELIDQGVGWLVSGIAISLIMRKRN